MDPRFAATCHATLSLLYSPWGGHLGLVIALDRGSAPSQQLPSLGIESPASQLVRSPRTTALTPSGGPIWHRGGQANLLSFFLFISCSTFAAPSLASTRRGTRPRVVAAIGGLGDRVRASGCAAALEPVCVASMWKRSTIQEPLRTFLLTTGGAAGFCRPWLCGLRLSLHMIVFAVQGRESIHHLRSSHVLEAWGVFWGPPLFVSI